MASRKRTKKRPRKPRSGSSRLTAWVHDVLNPWVASIASELKLLEAGNPTFRRYSKTLEFIRPLREYVPLPQHPTVEDALRADKDLAEKVQSHDAARDRLEEEARAAFEALSRDPQFSQEVSRARGLTQKSPGPSTMTDAEPVLLAAERVVNNIHSLGSHFLDHEFWNTRGRTLLEYRQGPHCERLNRAIPATANAFGQVQTFVVEMRFRLIEEFDLPPSPSPHSP